MTDTVRTRVFRWSHDNPAIESADELAAEEPLEIRVGGRPVSVTMRTPGHDHELTAGFLLTEGLLQVGCRPLLRHERPNVVNAALDHISDAAIASLTRNVFTSSSCGLCGKGTIESVHLQFPPVLVAEDPSLSPDQLLHLPNQLHEAQSAFSRTGGLHAAALFDLSDGLPRMVVAREDIGRHNAVDKVIGHAILCNRLPLEQHLLLVSGRASFEILQKALGARIPIIAAVSAPSSLAVEFANESGQTLVGFLREGRFNIYSHPERVRQAK